MPCGQRRKTLVITARVAAVRHGCGRLGAQMLGVRNWSFWAHRAAAGVLRRAFRRLLVIAGRQPFRYPGAVL